MAFSVCTSITLELIHFDAFHLTSCLCHMYYDVDGCIRATRYLGWLEYSLAKNSSIQYGWRNSIRLAARRGILVGEEVSIALIFVAARCVATASVLSSKFLCIPVHLSKERAVRAKHNDDNSLHCADLEDTVTTNVVCKRLYRTKKR